MRLLFRAWWLFAVMAVGAQMQHAPDGGSRETLQSIDVPVRPGAPFTAQVATSWKRRLEDGTEVTNYNRRTIARDSMGRVFQERRFLTPDGNQDPSPLSELDYDDPQTKTSTVCTVRTHQCLVRHWTHAPMVDLPQLPPTQQFPNGVTVTRESLGSKTVDTLQVTGTREVTTSPRFGDKEPAVRELWYSPKLGMNLITKRFLPSGGAQDFVLQNIDQNEPNAAVFMPPKDFQSIDIPTAPAQMAYGR